MITAMMLRIKIKGLLSILIIAEEIDAVKRQVCIGLSIKKHR